MTSKRTTTDNLEYYRPDDVPPDLTPLERSLIAMKQIRLWTEWWLQTGPAPPESEKLTQNVPKKPAEAT